MAGAPLSAGVTPLIKGGLSKTTCFIAFFGASTPFTKEVHLHPRN